MSEFILSQIIKTDKYQGVLMVIPELHRENYENINLNILGIPKVESYQNEIRSLKKANRVLKYDKAELNEMNHHLRKEIKIVRSNLREMNA